MSVPYSKGGQRRRRDDNEDSIEEYSSEGDFETLKAPVKMELDTEVYKMHENIELEWPSQTVCVPSKKNKVIVATAPQQADAQPEITELIVLPSFASMKSIAKNKAKKVDTVVNRIRANNSAVYTMSDTSLCMYTKSLNIVETHTIAGGYALAVTDNRVMYANGTKAVQRDSETEKSTVEEVEIPEAHEIFALAPISDTAAVVATRMLTIADYRSKETKVIHRSKCDINAVAWNKESTLVCGDDEGVLNMIDIRSEKVVECIGFHQSPITQIAFATPDIFATSSDCEVVLWDTSYTEEWEYHKYLSFVHQGQCYYKDFAFITPDTLITTSQDGLCMFTPKTEEESSAE